jgi:hypothetical protein
MAKDELTPAIARLTAAIERGLRIDAELRELNGETDGEALDLDDDDEDDDEAIGELMKELSEEEHAELLEEIEEDDKADKARLAELEARRTSNQSERAFASIDVNELVPGHAVSTMLGGKPHVLVPRTDGSHESFPLANGKR